MLKYSKSARSSHLPIMHHVSAKYVLYSKSLYCNPMCNSFTQICWHSLYRQLWIIIFECLAILVSECHSLFTWCRGRWSRSKACMIQGFLLMPASLSRSCSLWIMTTGSSVTSSPMSAAFAWSWNGPQNVIEFILPRAIHFLLLCYSPLAEDRMCLCPLEILVALLASEV